MADEAINSDFFKILLEAVKDFFEPGIAIFEDSNARAEFFGTLGLNDNGGNVNFPDAQNLENYINRESEEVDVFQLLSAFSDLTQLIFAIEGVIRGTVAAEDNPEFAMDEIFGSFINVLLLDFIRRKSPEVYAAFNLLQNFTTQTAAEGGMNNFFEDLIGPFFENLGKGLETEDSTKAVSDSVFIGLVGVLFILNKWVLGEDIKEYMSMTAGYGYEGVISGPTFNADVISNRFVNFAITVESDNPANQGTMYTTFGFVPIEHGGPAFMIDLSGELDATIPLSEKISLKFDASGEGVFRILEGAEAEAGKHNKISVQFKHDRKKADKYSFCDAPIIKLGFGTYSFKVSVNPEDFEIKAKFELPFEFGRGTKTGFPWNLLPEKIDEKIPLDFGYSISKGFFFGEGGSPGSPATDVEGEDGPSPEEEGEEDEPSFIGGLISMILNKIDLRIPIHKSIGDFLGFEILNLKTGVQGNFQALALETSLDFYLKFGSVMTISISRLGFNLNMDKREDNGGLFGYDLVPKVKPPTGAGIVIDAEIIKGGGYLYFDDEKGEYFGSLELEFKELFTLKAIGIINTKDDDGNEIFSMLVLITAEFTPIQLGFGFTLDGVGGLLGIDRVTDVETLRLGLKTNSIKSVLFPEDVVGNINRIVNDLKQIFPIQEDTFLIGLMAKLGWTSLLKLEVGLILELPDPKILILGVIKLALPDEDAEVLRLQVNFLGVIDFQNKFVYFEAQLFDSMVFGFTLTGSLAFAVGWGDDGLFGISVGGFHPDFRDYPNVPTLPGAFREMDRIGLSLLSGDNPRLTIEAYFAVTSNSLQFGAKLELLASGPLGFNLYGMLAFDAIFIFDPFSFKISLEATLAIRKGTSILFGIHFRGELSGPNPWHIEGEVTFGILFFDVTIGFSATWGDPPVEIASASEDLTARLVRELDTIENWRAITLPHQHEYVSIRDLEDDLDSPLILHPFGELQFSQRSIPLNFKMDKYGNNVPQDENEFSISKVKIGNDELSFDYKKESFASGHFIDLKEKEKLNRKSFESYDAGFTLKNSGKLDTAPPELDPTIMDYEVDYTNDNPKHNFVMPVKGFNILNRNAAVSKAEVSWTKTND